MFNVILRPVLSALKREQDKGKEKFHLTIYKNCMRSIKNG